MTYLLTQSLVAHLTNQKHQNMKHLINLLLIFPLFTFGQMTDAEFNKALETMTNSDQQTATSIVENAEKKYPNTDKSFYLRAFYQYMSGDQNAAMMSQSNAIKANPKFALAYDGRAELFFSKGMYDKAIADETKALQLEPENISFLMSRIRFYRANKQFSEALADAKTRIRLKPDGIMAYEEAATISKELNPSASGDEFFTQAYAVKAIEKCDTDAVYAKFLLSSDRFEEGRDKYELAYAACPTYFTADDHNSMGYAYYKTLQYEKSKVSYRRAMAMEPKNLIFVRMLGVVYIAQSDWQGLKEIATNGLAVNSNDAFCNKFYAIALDNTGQGNLAAEYHQKAERMEKEEKSRNNN